MKNPKEMMNEEHREALQFDVDKKSRAYHTDEKYDKVNEALSILTEAGIPAVIFAETDTSLETCRALLQLNNLHNWVSYSAGMATPESMLKACHVNHKLGYAFLDYFKYNCPTQNLLDYSKFIYELGARHSNKVFHGIPYPGEEEVKKLIEDGK